MKVKKISCLAAGAILSVLVLLSCNEKQASDKNVKKEAVEANKQLNEVARFISGLGASEDSKLYPFSGNQQYKLYAKQMDEIWTKYKETKLDKIELWRSKYLAGKSTPFIFYPFSGPDILNALAFFPESESFLMVGLEPHGKIPDPLSVKEENIYTGLWGIKKTLRTILQLNLFRTSEMQDDMRDDRFSNISAIMMFFLHRSGYEIINVRNVYLDDKGLVVAGDPEKEKGKKYVTGVDFVFRKGKDGKLKRATYLKVDVSDASLRKLQNFMTFINNNNDFTTMIKSASYLLSFEEFSTVRNYILARARFILQDDSGIPLKHYDEKVWNLSFHGKYRVLEMFRNRYQADLAKAMQTRTVAPLQFSYGYGFTPERSSVMIAERKKEEKK